MYIYNNFMWGILNNQNEVQMCVLINKLTANTHILMICLWRIALEREVAIYKIHRTVKNGGQKWASC